jgi:hypothetical protein
VVFLGSWGYGCHVHSTAIFAWDGKWPLNWHRSHFSRMFPCISDPAGNEYDLSALSTIRKPWTAVDTSVDGKKRTFYLSVCNPLPYIPGCLGECWVHSSFCPSVIRLRPAFFYSHLILPFLQAVLWGLA